MILLSIHSILLLITINNKSLKINNDVITGADKYDEQI